MKKIMSDISVSKKTIRQIPILKEKKEKIQRERIIEKKNQEEFDIPNTDLSPRWGRKPLNPKFAIWLIAAICLMSLFFGVSIIFSSATVIITPKIETISFDNDTYTAKSDIPGTKEISFEVLKVKQTIGEVVEATEEKEVSQKATGKIVIYNNYSTISQRLINNTRFEANNGKIYRISSSVVVPGYKKVGDKIIPGSIEAVVFADEAGELYNMKTSDLVGDFKIPGFKGDPRYDKFYALLKDDITGGLIGKQRIIDDTLRKSTIESIQLELKEQLLKELYAVKPENYLLFENGYSINYTILADTPVDDNKAKINIEGNLYGIVFNNSRLSQYFANKKIDGFDNLPTEFIPAQDLVVTMTAKDKTSLWKNDSLDIKITGNASIKWLYDSESIKRDLAGKKEADLPGLMSEYKNSLIGIKVFFRPVWSRYIPDDLKKIKIEEEVL